MKRQMKAFSIIRSDRGWQSPSGSCLCLVLVLLVAVISVGLLRLADLHDQLDTVVDYRYPIVLLAFDIKIDVNVIVRKVRAMNSAVHRRHARSRDSSATT